MPVMAVNNQNQHEEAGDYRSRPRWSAGKKMEAVLRLLRGESLEELSRELQVEGHRLAAWRDDFLEGGKESLKGQRPAWGARSRPAVMPRGRIHGSGRRGHHGGGVARRPAAPPRDSVLIAREPTGRGCGGDGGGCSAECRCQGRQVGAGGRRSGDGPGTPGARCQPSARRRHWRWAPGSVCG
jgi:hypothetical protein